MATAAYNSSVLITAQPAISLTNEVCTDSGDHTTYSITNSTKRYLDINTAVVVQKQTHGTGGFATVSNYTLKYVGGIITFASANNSDDIIRISSGAYYAYSTLGNGHTVEFSAKCNLADVTTFNTDGTMAFLPTLFGGTVKFSQWWTSIARINSVIARDLLVISFVTPLGNRYEGYTYASDCGLKLDPKSAIDEDITFQLTNQFFAN